MAAAKLELQSVPVTSLSHLQGKRTQVKIQRVSNEHRFRQDFAASGSNSQELNVHISRNYGEECTHLAASCSAAFLPGKTELFARHETSEQERVVSSYYRIDINRARGCLPAIDNLSKRPRNAAHDSDRKQERLEFPANFDVIIVTKCNEHTESNRKNRVVSRQISNFSHHHGHVRQLHGPDRR